MSKTRAGACILSFLLAVLLMFSGVQAAETDSLEDGIYSIDGVLRHASSDQNSMGNGAIKKPMELRIENGEATLRMEMVPLTASLGSTKFTGYLAYFYYFPDWEGSALPKDETPVALDVESYYEEVYDEYNHPDSGLDENVKGELYPHFITMPVTLYDMEIWTQVYVPVMESIVAGNGLQYARLQLDWDTLTRTGDLPEQEEPGEEDLSGSQNQNGSTEKTVDKGTLHTLLISAASLAGRESIYTEDSLTKLKNAIERAENVYSNGNATQTQVDTQVKTLTKAILNLQQKESGSTSGSGNGTASGETTAASDENLDFQNLEDGTYSVEGEIYKTDRETLSMANDAITHTIKLKVKNGNYTLTLDFKGLEMNAQFGYLGELKYFTSGYGTDSYGAPTGTAKAVNIKSYQTDSNGKKVTDSFGTDYPDKVTFPLIEEAKEDGWVPLQVFVPIMESISAGSGTQKAYLKLDTDSVSSAKKDAFKEEESTSGSQKSSGSSSKKSSASGSAVGAGTLKSGSSLPSGNSGGEGKSSQKAQTSTALQSALSGANTAAAQNGETPDASAESETAGDEEKKEETAGAALPSFMSFLAVLAGGAYKFWSRRLF